MTLDYSDLNYWKIVDLIILENDHLRSPHVVRSRKVAVHHTEETGFYHACCVFFHACCSFASGYNWEIVTPSFSQETLDKYNYYRLTGDLDISDYNSIVDEIKEVDEIVLADNQNQVLINAGYWPEYNDRAGNLQWHWMASPLIVEVEDDEVLNDRIQNVLHGFHIVTEDDPYLKIDDVCFKRWR
jgi:hypothetical protein